MRFRIVVLALLAFVLTACDPVGVGLPGAPAEPAAPQPVPPQPVPPDTATPAPVTPPPPAAPGAPTPSPDVDFTGAPSCAFPAAGPAVVAAGERCVLTQSATVGALTVNGQMKIDDVEGLVLRADEIMVEGADAVLQAGTMSRPLTSDVRIELNGADATRDAMGAGPNAFTTMAGGRVKLYGARGAEGYVYLSETARAGATALQLQQARDWVAGDEICVGATGYDPAETECRTVAAVAGTTVTLTEPLAFDHLGVAQEIGGRTLRMFAPVGLVTRNLVVTTGPQAAAAGVPGHTHFMSGPVEIAGVRFDGLGRPGELGQYPVHFHDNPAAGNFLLDSAITRSGNKCAVVHLTDGVLIQDNVAVDAQGSCFFVAENLVEVGSVVDHNMAALVRQAAAPVIDSDREHPCAFWFGNGGHTVTNNDGAGAFGGIGLCIETGEEPIGLAATRGVTAPGGIPPEHVEVGSYGPWQHNAMHSNSEGAEAHRCQEFLCGSGAWVLTEGNPAGRATYGSGGPDYTAGIGHAAPPNVVFDLTTYHNEGPCLWASDYLGFKRFAAGGCRDAVFGGHILLDDALLVGDTGVVPLHRQRVEGLRIYDGPLDVKDTVCANFSRPQEGCIGTNGSHSGANSSFYGVTMIDGMSFVNANPFFFSNADRPERVPFGPTAVFYDLVGDITGLGAGSRATYPTDPDPACQAFPAGNAKVCPAGPIPSGVDDRVTREVPASLPKLPEQPAGAAPGAAGAGADAVALATAAGAASPLHCALPSRLA